MEVIGPPSEDRSTCRRLKRAKLFENTRLVVWNVALVTADKSALMTVSCEAEGAPVWPTFG